MDNFVDWVHQNGKREGLLLAFTTFVDDPSEEQLERYFALYDAVDEEASGLIHSGHARAKEE